MEKALELLPTLDHAQKLPGLGFQLPTRMTVLPLGAGQLALVSPVPIDDAVAAGLAKLGEVRFLIAPNMLHHMYLGAAIERYPAARVLAPAGLRAKRPDLRIDGTLDGELPAELTAAVEIVHIAGASNPDEFVFFHRATRTLVVTDLVFNIVCPQGLVAHLVLFLAGCHGRLAQSRFWRFAIKDRAAAAHSIARVLALPIETLVMAHGEIVRDRAQQRLADALRWLLPVAGVLPATTERA
jgi:hypothetical protein